jgi:hypothetical protein
MSRCEALSARVATAVLFGCLPAFADAIGAVAERGPWYRPAPAHLTMSLLIPVCFLVLWRVAR